MDDIKINNLLSRYAKSCSTFRGVFGKNQSDLGTKGTHWICAYLNTNADCDFFDSYRISPLKKLIPSLESIAKVLKTSIKIKFKPLIQMSVFKVYFLYSKTNQ